MGANAQGDLCSGPKDDKRQETGPTIVSWGMAATQIAVTPRAVDEGTWVPADETGQTSRDSREACGSYSRWSD